MPKNDRVKIAFLASSAELAQSALASFVKKFRNFELDDAEIIVALGGDGFMLQTDICGSAGSCCRSESPSKQQTILIHIYMFYICI